MGRQGTETSLCLSPYRETPQWHCCDVADRCHWDHCVNTTNWASRMGKMEVTRKSILNTVAVILLTMVPPQVLASDLAGKIKTASEQTKSDIIANVRKAAKKEADRHLKEMKAGILIALDERLCTLAKQSADTHGNASAVSVTCRSDSDPG